VNITTWAQAVVTAIRWVGPVFVGLALLLLGVYLASSTGRARIRLALRGLKGKRRMLARSLLAGTLVPALGAMALAVSLSLESEIRDGPNRVLVQLSGLADSSRVAWILEKGTGHFMDDSSLATMQHISGTYSANIIPFWSQLALVDTPRGQLAGLVVALPIPSGSLVFGPLVNASTAKCSLVRDRCRLGAGQAITDGNAASVGKHITIRGQQLTVAANPDQPVSMLNRAVVFVAPSLFQLSGGSMAAPYGAIVGGPNPAQEARAYVDLHHIQNFEILTESQLEANNSAFWAGNGTPLILMIITLSALFSGVALYAGRRASLEQARVELGTLRTLGLSAWHACAVDLCRALIKALVGSVLAWPFAVALINVTDAQIFGFHGELTAPTMAAGCGVIIAANIFGTMAMWQVLRRSSIVEAINDL